MSFYGYYFILANGWWFLIEEIYQIFLIGVDTHI